MTKKTELKHLKRGDWIKIEFGYSISYAKVLNNLPLRKDILL